MFTIRADLREQRSGIINVLENIKESKKDSTNSRFEIIQEVLTVGDYIIECGMYVLIIERKAVADLAASIIDRRIYENHVKLLDAAKSTCGMVFRVMYLIEGPSFKPDNTTQKIGGIAVSSLRSKLDHLMMSDNCQIEWTSNTQHTAERLVELGKNMFTIKNNTPVLVTAGNIDIGAIVKKKYDKSELIIQHEMLTCITGIGPKIAEKLLNSYTFLNIINGNLPPNIISPKIEADIKLLKDGQNKIIERNMFARIKGISLSMADDIASITSILSFDENVVADLKREQGRRMGNTVASRIKNIIEYTKSDNINTAVS